MLTCLAILGLWLCGADPITVQPAEAQTYGQAQWGVQQGTSTPNVVIFDGAQNVAIGQLNTTTHTWTPSITGPLSLASTLSVAGNTTLSGTLSVAGNTTLSGTLSVAQTIAGASASTFPSISGAGGPLTVTNLYSSPPSNGYFVSGQGAAYSYCSVVGCVAGDHLRGQDVLFMTTQQDATIQESAFTVNVTSATGKALVWATGTPYTAGQQVENAARIYQAVNSATSGASAPTCGSGTCSDGAVTWQYLAAFINQGKEGITVGNHITSTGSPTWALNTSSVIDVGAGNQVGYFLNEFDVTNNNLDCAIGVLNCADVFFSFGSAFPLTAVEWMTGGSSATYAAHIGIFFQGANLIKDDSILDSSSSTFSYYDNGTHQSGAVYVGTYTQAGVVSKGIIDTGVAAAVPTTGQTVIIADTNDTEIIAPAGGLAALTVQLPTCATNFNGKVVRFSSSQAVTTLTVTATAGSVGAAAPSSLVAGVGPSFVCSAASTTWYRLN